MRNQILQFPKQLSEGVKLARDIKIDKTYERVVICGMGGSIIPAEIFLSSISPSEGPTKYFINRDYNLPKWVNKNDLVICVSWSGDTEETISSYKAALELGADTIVITKGGQLMAKALLSANRAKLIRLPDDKIPPRLAAGYMTGALFDLLNMGNEFDFDLKVEGLEKEGQEIASQIDKKMPLIYSSFRWRKLAGLWKGLFNENTKVPAFWNFFPSAAHNEIAGFNEQLGNVFHPVFIKSGDNDRGEGNLDTAIAFFKRMSYNYSIVNLSGNSPLEKVLKGYILGLWASYYLAKNLGVDPADTAQIENFKRLKRKPIPKIRLAK